MSSTRIISRTGRTARCLYAPEPVVRRTMCRSMATEISNTSDAEAHEPLITTSATPAEIANTASTSRAIRPLSHVPPANPFIKDAQCTLHSFPSLEPTGFATYPSTHLMLPLRRDILHRAVIFEADGKRQGTASTKWRDEVHGSGRKMRPQKGTGKSRMGDKKSPVIRGGGVAFGPKPRDFSTDLPRKIYDLAWRTALSFRFRRGQLIVVDGNADLAAIINNNRARYMKEMLAWHSMGHTNGRTLIITQEKRVALADTFDNHDLSKEGQLVALEHVDVKHLLNLGRIIIEHSALDQMLREHESDVVPTQRLKGFAPSL